MVEFGRTTADERNGRMINRISFNGCRYLITRDLEALEEFCRTRGIPEEWIRHQRGKHYLRLWGEWKSKAW